MQLDAEAWSTSLSDVTSSRPLGNIYKTKDSLEKTIRTFRKHNLKSKIGFYSLLPVNKYTYSNINDETKYKSWQQQNDILKNIYDSVDVFFPSCYTRNPMVDSVQWKKYTMACIDEIRRLSPYKPIIVGLTLQYAGGESVEYKFIEPEYLKYQLETLLADGRVQGVFYWTSNRDEAGIVGQKFDKDMPWLKCIYQFVKKHNLQ